MEKKLMVAKSYQNWARVGEPFEKNGKLYQKVKTKCDRCGGLGIIVARVENGRPIPIPVDEGICYQCAGVRYITKEVRLYTPEEYKRMETVNEKARQKKAEELEARMKAEFQENKKKWLSKNGFNENETTWIITGDSYSIKDELKENNFIYDSVLRWHKATKDENYADRLIEVKLSDIAEWSAWGQAHFTSEAKKFIDNLLAETQPQVDSNWIGEVGEKIKDIKVQLTRKYSFETKYGFSTCFNFADEDGNVLVWFTSTIQDIEQGQWLKIKYATIKKLDTYKDVKQTILTRAKLADLDPA